LLGLLFSEYLQEGSNVTVERAWLLSIIGYLIFMQTGWIFAQVLALVFLGVGVFIRLREGSK